MIHLTFTQAELDGLPEYPPFDLHVDIDDESLTWLELMQVFARQLPKFGYAIETTDLELALADCAIEYRGKTMNPKRKADHEEWVDDYVPRNAI